MKTAQRHTPEARSKISQARREFAKAHPYELPDRKRCNTCRVMKDIDEFYVSKRKVETTGETREYPRPLCKLCDNERNRLWKERKKREGTWSEYIRALEQRIKDDPVRHERKKQQQREHQTIRRRRMGAKPRALKRHEEKGKGGKLDLEPFGVWLSQQVVSHGIDEICARTGLDEKQIRRWCAGKDEGGVIKTVSVESADRVFIALDAPDEMAILYPV